MHKLVEMKKYENEIDDNNEKDYEEDGVDVLSGSCRPRFAIICKMRYIIFIFIVFQLLERLDKAFRACIEFFRLTNILNVCL